MNDLIVVRGGGDIATGSIQKLHRAGFKVLVLEVEEPTCIRKTVAVAQAVYEGRVEIEDITAVFCKDKAEIDQALANNMVAVAIDPTAKLVDDFKPLAVVDGILAKKNLGTNRDMAPITIGLGPGFRAGADVDVVIETNRGHNLGRLIFDGPAAANTGNPGNIAGFTIERILRAPATGKLTIIKDIGAFVAADEVVAEVDGIPMKTQIRGIVRGMINDDLYVKEGMKVGDVDPRAEPSYAHSLSDKARAIGGAVLEAVLIEKRKKGL